MHRRLHGHELISATLLLCSVLRLDRFAHPCDADWGYAANLRRSFVVNLDCSSRMPKKK
jgi:hypothetical protein